MPSVIALLLLVLLTPLAMAADNAFTPTGPTVTLAVSGTTARVQYQPTPSGPNVRVFNSSTVVVFVACGEVTITSTVAAGLPIAPGTVELIGCPNTHMAGISGGSAATVYFTPGFGQ